MIYANGDIYEGSWLNDMKHGYGIIEKKNGDKYYGYWNLDLKEGQGYYYYSSTGKIYLGEWHEDVPRCGIFTDVDDENLKKEYKKHYKAEDGPPNIPVLKLLNPDEILEESISKVHFLRTIKEVKNKNFSELFDIDFQNELIKIFQQRRYQLSEEEKNEESNKIPDTSINFNDFCNICLEKIGCEFDSK
jgi:hypothetical protein